LGALLLAAQLPELVQRHLQLAKAVAERALDIAECIPYGLDVSWLRNRVRYLKNYGST